MIATSLKELKNDYNVSNNYLGDTTEEFREELKEFSKHPEFLRGGLKFEVDGVSGDLAPFPSAI